MRQRNVFLPFPKVVRKDSEIVSHCLHYSLQFRVVILNSRSDQTVEHGRKPQSAVHHHWLQLHHAYHIFHILSLRSFQHLWPSPGNHQKTWAGCWYHERLLLETILLVAWFLSMHQAMSLHHHHPLCVIVCHWDKASQKDRHFLHPWLSSMLSGPLKSDQVSNQELCWKTILHQSLLPVWTTISKLVMTSWQTMQPLEGHHLPGQSAG